MQWARPSPSMASWLTRRAGEATLLFSYLNVDDAALRTGLRALAEVIHKR